MPGNLMMSILSDPNVAGVPPSVSTQNFLCASTLDTLRSKWPTTAGAVVMEIWADGLRGRSANTARMIAVDRRFMAGLYESFDWSGFELRMAPPLTGRGRSRYTACEARRMGHGDSKAQRNRYCFSVSWCLGGRYPPCLAARVDFHHGLLRTRRTQRVDHTRPETAVGLRREASMSLRLAIAVMTAAILSVPGFSRAQVLMQRDVSLRMALTIAETALAQCGVNTSVAVVDRAGRLRVFLQGDNANPHNIELARRKAYTARTFRQPSSAWAKRTETANTGQRMLADVIPLGGGMPINVGQETIGGVGLSGAPGGQEQEEACAKAGIDKVADQLK